MQLTKNFWKRELNCPCRNCEKDKLPDNEFITLLQKLRDEINLPLYIAIGGGVRCTSYNKKVGGYIDSPHVLGKAADIYRKGYNYKTLAKLAKQVGFKRVGIYPFTYNKFIHVDTIEPYPSEAWVRDSQGIYHYYKTLEGAIASL